MTTLRRPRFARSGLGLAILLSITARASASGAPPAATQLGTPTRQFFAVSVPDVEVAAAWYERVLGLARTADRSAPDGKSRAILLGSPTLFVELMRHEEARPLAVWAPDLSRNYLAHGFFKVGIFVPDFDAALAHLQANEVELFGRIVTDEELGFRFVLFRDVAGNLLQLFGPAAAAAPAAEGGSPGAARIEEPGVPCPPGDTADARTPPPGRPAVTASTPRGGCVG